MRMYHWEAALSHGAGVEQETSDREQAYARFTRAKQRGTARAGFPTNS
jgi:hypothetical protein